MYIIDTSYFIKNINVPNTKELQSGNTTQLEMYIDQYVRECLKSALGYELFKDLDQYVIDGVFNANENAPQKWLDFVFGKEYEKNNQLMKWQGLYYTEGLFKNSLLAKYVFYHWYKDNVTTLSSIGEVNLQAKNAVTAEPNQRLVSVWNEFVYEYQYKQTMNASNLNIYFIHGIPVYDWFTQNGNNFVSLLQFLTDNKENYENATMKEYKYQNQFGL